MKVRIEFTHYRGQLAGRGNSARPVLSGQLLSHLLVTRRGSHQVAKLCSENVMEKPLAELYEARLYCISPQGFQLRGCERINTKDGEAWVLQGWLVSPL